MTGRLRKQLLLYGWSSLEMLCQVSLPASLSPQTGFRRQASWLRKCIRSGFIGTWLPVCHRACVLQSSSQTKSWLWRARHGQPISLWRPMRCRLCHSLCPDMGRRRTRHMTLRKLKSSQASQPQSSCHLFGQCFDGRSNNERCPRRSLATCHWTKR